MGNLIRIVAGVGGLTAATWSAVRTARARRAVDAVERPTYVGTFAILATTATVIAATVLV